WQGLERGHEGERDRFALLVADLGVGWEVEHTLEEGVGKWLEPHHLPQPGRLGPFDPGQIPLLDWPPAGRATGVEAAVGRDAIEPCSGRAAPLEPCQALPRSKQRLLQDLL